MSKNKSLDELKFKLEYALENGVDIDNRIIRVSGFIGHSGDPTDVSEYSDFSSIDSALNYLEKISTTEPITIRINSGGGFAYEALAMVGRMHASPCPIKTQGFGHVMSAATLILAAGDIRQMSKYCLAMFHESQGQVGGGTSSIKDGASQMEQEEKLWASWMAELSYKDKNFWRRKIKKKDIYLTADEMLSWGVIDKVI